MKTPIDILFDRVRWKCTICRSESGTCGCWIEGQCQRCGVSRKGERGRVPAEVVRITLKCCLQCSDTVEEIWIDAAGGKVPQFDDDENYRG